MPLVARPVPKTEAGEGLFARHRRGWLSPGSLGTGTVVPVAVGAGEGLVRHHRQGSLVTGPTPLVEPGKRWARHHRGLANGPAAPLVVCQGKHLPLLHMVPVQPQFTSEDVDAAVAVGDEGQLWGGVEPEVEAALDLVLGSKWKKGARSG